MKRAFFALGLMVLAVAPAGAGSLGVHGAWVDTDQADNDVGFGLRFEFAATRAVDIHLRGTDFRELMATVDGEDFFFQTTMIDLGFAYNFVKEGRALTPYVGGGGTYFLLDSTDDSTGRLEDEYGWYGLLGADLAIAERWTIYLEGMWRDAKATVKGDDLDLLGTVDQSVNLNGPQVNLGIAFAW